MDNQETVNKPPLSMVDGVALIVGLVIKAGIFETPSLVAANTGNATSALALWLVGGIISLVGAVCVAELATTYPHPGGNYHYLQRAFGQRFAFLEAWARITVVQTGSLALLAFVFGDYASQIWRLGKYSPSIYAVALIIVFTGMNLLGIHQAKWMQNVIAAAIILGLALVIVSALVFVTPNSSPTIPPTTTSNTILRKS
jgi:APA family basic amino acid/polyamine antiporter